VVEPTGFLVVAEHFALRRVSPAGRVVTLAGGTTRYQQRDGVGQGAGFGYITGLGRAPDGTLFVSEGGPRYLPDGGKVSLPVEVRRVTPLGETSTVWRADGGVYLSDVAMTDAGLFALAKSLPPGQEGLAQLFTDGGWQLRSEACQTSDYGRLQASGDGFLCTSAERAVLVSADGGATTLASFTAPFSRGWAISAAEGAGEAYAVAYSGGCGLWRLVDGGAESVVGYPIQHQAASGTVRAVGSGPGGEVVFTTTRALYRVGADGGAEGPVATTTSGWWNDLQVVDGGVWGLNASGLVSDLTAEPDGGQPLCTCALGGSLAFSMHVAGGGAVCVGQGSLSVCSPDAGSRQLFGPASGPSDGPPGVGQLSFATDIEADGDGGYYVTDGLRLRHLAPDSTLSTVAGAVGSFGMVDGPVGSARFATLRAVARTDTGLMLLDDDVGAGLTAVRRVANGQVSTLAQLADSATDMEAEDGGSLLVVVPGAILRVRPQ